MAVGGYLASCYTRGGYCRRRAFVPELQFSGYRDVINILAVFAGANHLFNWHTRRKIYCVTTFHFILVQVTIGIEHVRPVAGRRLRPDCG